MIITDLGEIGENAIIVFEENVGVGAEEIVANQEYVAYTGDSDDVIQVCSCQFVCRIVSKIHRESLLSFSYKISHTNRKLGCWMPV